MPQSLHQEPSVNTRGCPLIWFVALQAKEIGKPEKALFGMLRQLSGKAPD
jgi:hypothetical protein